MKPLENAWSGLKQRRLLPVAILLLAALVAIPFVLAKDPEPTSPGVPAADNGAAKDVAPVADPVVTLAEDGSAVKARRRVLGASKNPFQPARAAKVSSATSETGGTTVAAAPQPGVDGAGDPGTGPGSSSGPAPGADTPSTPAEPTTPAATPTQPRPKEELYSVTVRFGPSESDSLERSVLPRLKALPSPSEPVLVYLGPGDGGKTAVFVLDEAIEPQGDGVCNPNPANCETLHMRPGDTEFLDVRDENGEVSAQYQLDVVKIKTSKASASKAAAARAKLSRAGLSVLRARTAAVGPLRYRYEAKSGLVRKLGKRAYRSLMAKSARVALGTAGGF